MYFCYTTKAYKYIHLTKTSISRRKVENKQSRWRDFSKKNFESHTKHLADGLFNCHGELKKTKSVACRSCVEHNDRIVQFTHQPAFMS